MGPASSTLSSRYVTDSESLSADSRECFFTLEVIESGDDGSRRRVMDRIGTRAAAVPAAITSVNWGSSAYLIYSRVSNYSLRQECWSCLPISFPPSNQSSLQGP